jgi:hypothetical protein
MNWPRGKYNGDKIVGFHIIFKFRITSWYWHWCWESYQHSVWVGPFGLFIDPEYKQER